MNTQSNKIGDWIIQKNNQYIVFNKPAGIPVQEDKTGDKSLLQLAEIYTKNKLHIIHRIDRPASGIMIFAKQKTALVSLNQQFQDRSIQKTYFAVVKNRPQQDQAELIHYLKKNASKNTSKALNKPVDGAKQALLSYQLIDSIDNYHLLKIDLKTGRHHQIRAQLAAIGCPIKGDVKYGFRRGNKDRSIHLHAWKLEFQHPITKEKISLTAPPPLNDSVWGAFDYFLRVP